MEEERVKVEQIKKNRKGIAKELLKIVGYFVIAELLAAIYVPATYNSSSVKFDINDLNSIWVHVITPIMFYGGIVFLTEKGKKSVKQIYHNCKDNKKIKNDLKQKEQVLKMS